MGALFTALVVGLLFMQACGEPHVPKPRRFIEGQNHVKVYVCGHNLELMLEAQALLPDVCGTRLAFEHTPDASHEACDVDEFDRISTVAVRIGDPGDAAAVTDYWMEEVEGWWESPEGPLAVGVVRSVAVTAPSTVSAPVMAHELGHVCGYGHAFLGDTQIFKNRHLMSPKDKTIGTDTQGMELGLTDYDADLVDVPGSAPPP